MEIPAKLIERKALLDAKLADYHKTQLEISREVRLTHAQIDEIVFAIAAIEDAAASVSAEAGVGEVGVSPTPQGGEQTPHSAGTGAKPPRAPRRNFRSLVLAHVENYPGQTVERIARALGNVPPRAVEKAVAYWQHAERMTLAGGVVLLRAKLPEFGISGASVPVEAAEDDPDPGAFAEHYGHGLDEAAARDQFEGTDRLKLIAYLTQNPASPMRAIMAAGISANEVYRAERDGVVVATAHGLYSLAEAESQQAAE